VRGSEEERVGLCAHCVHAKEIRSERGSLFYLCGLSAVDPAFPKYPRLPVIECSGYLKKTEQTLSWALPSRARGRCGAVVRLSSTTGSAAHQEERVVTANQNV